MFENGFIKNVKTILKTTLILKRRKNRSNFYENNNK